MNIFGLFGVITVDSETTTVRPDLRHLQPPLQRAFGARVHALRFRARHQI